MLLSSKMFPLNGNLPLLYEKWRFDECCNVHPVKTIKLMKNTLGYFLKAKYTAPSISAKLTRYFQ